VFSFVPLDLVYSRIPLIRPKDLIKEKYLYICFGLYWQIAVIEDAIKEGFYCIANKSCVCVFLGKTSTKIHSSLNIT